LILILSLQKAQYKVLEEDESPVELEKEYNLQTTQKKTIRENKQHDGIIGYKNWW
jgi:hypothetical protein